MEKKDGGMLLTSDEAAELLNLPTHRILIMIHLQQLPAVKVGAGFFQILKSAPALGRLFRTSDAAGCRECAESYRTTMLKMAW